MHLSLYVNRGPIIRIMFGQKNNAFAIQHIGFALLYVGCLES